MSMLHSIQESAALSRGIYYFPSIKDLRVCSRRARNRLRGKGEEPTTERKTRAKPDLPGLGLGGSACDSVEGGVSSSKSKRDSGEQHEQRQGGQA